MGTRKQAMERILQVLPVWVLVIDRKNSRLLYSNREYEDFSRKRPETADMTLQQLVKIPMEPGAACILEIPEKQGNIRKWKFVLAESNLDWEGIPAAVYCSWDMTEELSKGLMLERESNTDSMTGLYNRRYCRKTIQRCLDDGVPFSVGFIDINSLKLVNDRFGHAEGDRYIMTVAELLRKTFRAGDVICRYGGDEFVVILEYCSQEKAEEKLVSIQRRLKTWQNCMDYKMGICFGLEEVNKEMRSEVDRVLSLADRKMYQMKKISKN